MNDLQIAEKIATRNPHTYRRKSHYPNVSIYRKSSDGTTRVATYHSEKEGKPLQCTHKQ